MGVGGYNGGVSLLRLVGEGWEELFAAVLFADEDCFEDAQEEIANGFCGHRVCVVI